MLSNADGTGLVAAATGTESSIPTSENLKQFSLRKEHTSSATKLLSRIFGAGEVIV